MATRRLGLLVFGAAFIVLFVVVAIAVGIGHQGVAAGEVAVVEDVPGGAGTISETDFRHAVEQSAAQAGLKALPKPGESKYEELKGAALNSLLEAAWLEGQANEMGISATAEEVAAELKKLKKQNFKTEAEYQKFIKKSHYTQADVNQRVKLTIFSGKIQKQLTEGAAKPSGGEVQGYYEAAKGTQFMQKASRDVRMIVNKDRKKVEQAKALLEKDHSVVSWTKVAKQYSTDPLGKSSGGLRSGLTEGMVEEPVNAAIFGAAKNKIEGPVKAQNGYYVFDVEKETPERVQPLSQVRSQIESQLSQRAQQEHFATFVAGYSARWRSRTFCASGYTSEHCANFKGSGHPATAPPACYESHPKAGRPEACPAPVSQLAPALPGSVTLLEPRGKPLPQRPRPSGLKETPEPAAMGTPQLAP